MNESQEHHVKQKKLTRVMYTHPIFKMDNQQDPVQSTWDSAQWAASMGEGFGREQKKLTQKNACYMPVIWLYLYEIPGVRGVLRNDGRVLYLNCGSSSENTHLSNPNRLHSKNGYIL